MMDTIIHWKRCVGATEKARRKLKRLLTTKVRPRHHRQQLGNFTTMDNYIAYAASFLQAHPVLASEKIRGLYPLVHILLAAAAHSAPVIAVCRLYTEALKRPFRFGDQSWNLPLHLACKKGYDRSVIEAMIQGYPVAASVRNSVDELPVHCAIRCSTGTAMEAASFLVQVNSSCVMQKVPLFPGSDRRLNLMEFAIAHSANLDLLTLIANHFDKDEVNLRVHAGIVDVDQAKAIALLLPNLKVFECTPSGYTRDGFILLMRSLQENRSIKDITYLSLPEFPLESVASALYEAAFQFLYHNDTVSRLMVGEIARHDNVLRSPSEQGDKWLLAIGTGLRANRTIQTLFLHRWSVSGRALATFLSDGSAPVGLVLCGVQVEQHSLDDLVIEQQNWDLCRVQSLVIKVFTHSAREYFIRIPKLAEMMPTLRYVSFLSDISPFMDGTRQVATMLKIEHLRILETTGVSLDPDAICDKLKTNKTLFGLCVQGVFDTDTSARSLLKILERHNTTLVAFSDRDMACPKLYEKICYWTRLNAFGRNDFRLTKIPLDQLVRYLQAAMGSPEEYLRFAGLLNARPDLMKGVTQGSVNTLYGLLRECPAVWSLVN